MLQFIRHLGPEVLDAIIIAVLILPLIYGALRGFKNIVINFLCYVLSVLIAFTHVGENLRLLVSDKILVIDKWVSGNNTVNLMANTYSNLLAAVFVFVVIYLVALLAMTLLNVAINRKRNWEPAKKNIVGRIFAALFIFLYNGVTIIALFLTVNTNTIGIKFLTEDTMVVKHIVSTSEDLLDKIEEGFADKLVLKLRQGNILYNVDGEKESTKRVVTFAEYQAAADALDGRVELMISKNYSADLEDKSLGVDKIKVKMADAIRDVNNLALISMKLGEKNESLAGKFTVAAEEIMRSIDRVVMTEGNGIDGVEMTLEEASLIRINLKDAGADDKTIQYFDEVIKTR